LFGTAFWGGLKDWIKNTMLEQFGTISPKDMDLLPVTDDIEEVVKIINEFYKEDGTHTLEPNLEL
jgi:predicted Rossmann-fold nucleotide-binding protein